MIFHPCSSNCLDCMYNNELTTLSNRNYCSLQDNANEADQHPVGLVKLLEVFEDFYRSTMCSRVQLARKKSKACLKFERPRLFLFN